MTDAFDALPAWGRATDHAINSANDAINTLTDRLEEAEALLEAAEHRRGARVPYDPRSPWNTPISTNAQPIGQSAVYMNAISDNGIPLTSDVDQFSIPVYLFDGNTKPVPVTSQGGFFGSYDQGDGVRVGYGTPWKVMAPVPAEARAGVGSDGQIILWDPDTGVEWAFWQLVPQPDGSYVAENGYRTHTTPGYFGRFADGKAGRGAGTTYLAGLVRAWEIKRGQIDHALAFAFKSPGKTSFVYPASKTDGQGVTNVDPPEGTRIQLDPAKTDADFDTLGLHPNAKTICRALQTYGMYVVDNSGSSKLIMEARHTANWGDEFTRSMLSAVPWTWFRVVAAPAPPA